MNNQKSSILVIEDNEGVRNGIISLLDYCGYRSEGFSTYNERVIEKIKSEPVDLIILDVMLSGVDGRDVATQLKSLPEASHIPILMTSAYPNIEAAAKQAGGDGFLAKPFGLQEIEEKVEAILQVSR